MTKQTHDIQRFCFVSDNYSGVHPTIMQAIINANGGHDGAYGEDFYSRQLTQIIQGYFGKTANAYPVLNGTGANVIALSAMTSRFGAVICADNAHINQDEGNAPEYIAGIKLLTTPSDNGKITPEDIARLYHTHHNNPHKAQPQMVYISQATEFGTCYSVEELKAIAQMCKTCGLYLYVDGARIANALAHLGIGFGDLADIGIDMLSIGGTKNGMMIGECLVVLNDKFGNDLRYLRKNNLHLASKMRFISAQFVAWFEDNLWQQMANHSNAMAKRLYDGIKHLPNITLIPCQSNAVFVKLPDNVIAKLQQQFEFYTWGDDGIRLMTSFDSTEAQIDEIITAITSYSA